MQDLTKILKIGDTVYCAIYGEGIVQNINLPSNPPIEVLFSNLRITKYYNTRGSICGLCLTTLSYEPWPDAVPFPEPQYQPKFDEVVAVWNNDEKMAVRRHFCDFSKNGKTRCFAYGKSSKTITESDQLVAWDNIKKIES